MISFQPTEEQQMIVDTVRDFARERMREVAHDAAERRALDAGVLATADELGLVVANIPEKYGGYGESYSAVTGVLLAEQLAYGDLSTALHVLAPASVATPILRFGTGAQRERYLPRFADEGLFASAALVEPRWNFDPAELATRAQRDGENYIISGQKSYVIAPANGSGAHLLLVYAHDEAANSTQAFLVESSTEGVTIGERERGMGLDALAYHRVTLDEVEVPAADRLGGDEGININTLLDHARVGGAALATGLARGAYEFAQEYAKEREAFGKPVARFQAIAFMLAEMRIAVESMQLLTWEAAWRLDQNDSGATEAAVVARQFADEYVLQVADRAVQILGGHGYIREYPVERWLREARAFANIPALGMV